MFPYIFSAFYTIYLSVNFLFIFVQDHEYLIKWDGWPLECCSWEPSLHLSEDLLRLLWTI